MLVTKLEVQNYPNLGTTETHMIQSKLSILFCEILTRTIKPSKVTYAHLLCRGLRTPMSQSPGLLSKRLKTAYVKPTKLTGSTGIYNKYHQKGNRQTSRIQEKRTFFQTLKTNVGKFFRIVTNPNHSEHQQHLDVHLDQLKQILKTKVKRISQ